MKIVTAIIVFFGLCFSSFAEKYNFFNEAKILFEEENMKIQNFCFKEILSTIQKMLSPIYI